MPNSSQSQAARRLGKITQVPVVQARVKNHVVVPQSTVMTRRAAVPLPKPKTVSPLSAFVRGIAFLIRDLLMVPFSQTSSNRFKNLVGATLLFIATPIAAGVVFVQHAPIVEHLRVVAFGGCVLAAFMGMCVLTSVGRSLKPSLRQTFQHVVARGQRK